jgi:hypothetical protein
MSETQKTGLDKVGGDPKKLERFVILALDEADDPVDIDYIREQTPVGSVSEAKAVLRRLSEKGWITTTSNWEYKLASQRR